jgi:curli biogenesis system outer membrane secretion channel CsgG
MLQIRPIKTVGIALLLSLSLSACTQPLLSKRPISSLPPQMADTPITKLLMCVGKHARLKVESKQSDFKHLAVVAVNPIPDRTGKFDYNANGAQVTQGAQDILISALSKTGAYHLVERNNLDIPLFELKYANNFMLSDNNPHNNIKTTKGQTGRKIISGDYLGADYYLTGSLTDINFTVDSGGVQGYINGIGGQWRSYWISVSLDLRLVNTKTLRIQNVIPVRKYLRGYVNRFGVYHIWDDTLVDSSAGKKREEPIGMAVRSTLESAVYRLTTQLYGLSPNVCMTEKEMADDFVYQKYTDDRVIDPTSPIPKEWHEPSLKSPPVEKKAKTKAASKATTKPAKVSQAKQATKGSVNQAKTVARKKTSTAVSATRQQKSTRGQQTTRSSHSSQQKNAPRQQTTASTPSQKTTRYQQNELSDIDTKKQAPSQTTKANIPQQAQHKASLRKYHRQTTTPSSAYPPSTPKQQATPVDAGQQDQTQSTQPKQQDLHDSKGKETTQQQSTQHAQADDVPTWLYDFIRE